MQWSNTLQYNGQILLNTGQKLFNAMVKKYYWCVSSALVKFCSAWSARLESWFTFILILTQFLSHLFPILVKFVSKNVKNLSGAVVSKQVCIVCCIQPRPRINLVPNICYFCIYMFYIYDLYMFHLCCISRICICCIRCI